jgi:hypothetical protein
MDRIGVWIDQREANLIKVTDKGVMSKTIYSDIETRIRIAGEKKQFSRFGDQFIVDEKGKENRVNEYTQKFLQKILKEVSSEDQILLFGPSQTKFKLEKLILSRPELAVKLLGTKTADNMTHNQKLAYVRDFYKVE